jgi:hypothetical protein
MSPNIPLSLVIQGYKLPPLILILMDRSKILYLLVYLFLYLIVHHTLSRVALRTLETRLRLHERGVPANALSSNLINKIYDLLIFYYKIIVILNIYGLKLITLNPLNYLLRRLLDRRSIDPLKFNLMTMDQLFHIDQLGLM